MIGNAGSLAVMCYARGVSPAQVSPMRAGMLLCARSTILWHMDAASGKQVPVVMHGCWSCLFGYATSSTYSSGMGDAAVQYIQEGHAEDFERCARALCVALGVQPTPSKVSLLRSGVEYSAAGEANAAGHGHDDSAVSLVVVAFTLAVPAFPVFLRIRLLSSRLLRQRRAFPVPLRIRRALRAHPSAWLGPRTSEPAGHRGRFAS